MPKPRRAYPLLILVGRSADLGRLEQALQNVDGSPGALTVGSCPAAAEYLLGRAARKGRDTGPLPLMVILDEEVEGAQELLDRLKKHPLLRYVVPLILARRAAELKLAHPSLVLPRPSGEAGWEQLARKVRGLLPDTALH